MEGVKTRRLFVTFNPGHRGYDKITTLWEEDHHRDLKIFEEKKLDDFKRWTGWDDIVCCAMQTEMGENGNHHIQACFIMSERKRIRTWRGIIEGHVEAMRGSVQQAVEYCTKEASRNIIWGTDAMWTPENKLLDDSREILFSVIFGEVPVSQQGRRTDHERAQELVQSRTSAADIWDEMFGYMVKHHKGIMEAMKYYPRQRTWVTKVWILYGDSGTGKTLMATNYLMHKYGRFYEQNGSPKWFDGYTDQEGVLVNEFEGQWPFAMWKRLCDVGAVRVETKGGSVPFLAREIIFTSNKDPETWWNLRDSDEVKQMERRCNGIIHVLELHLYEDKWEQIRIANHGEDLEVPAAGPGRPWDANPTGIYPGAHPDTPTTPQTLQREEAMVIDLDSQHRSWFLTEDD